ncbi:TIGR01906 family membrane protein [Aerococcaceae bacterium DSM 111021]|nr:TIGR01906 family membrane protein [Aerococcaceae bacterium DSM 111021]
MDILKRGVSSLVIFLFAISTSITTVIFTSPFVYSLCIGWFNLSSISGLTQEQLMINYEAILKYLINPTIHELNMPYFSMSQGGAQHFDEVKVLFFVNFIIFVILLLLTICAIVLIKKNNWQILMVPHFTFKLSFPLIFLFFIVIAFDRVFIIFHQLLFNNDLWLFNPLEDPVITVLPQEFFMLLFIIVLLAYEAVVLAIRKIIYWRK